MTDEIKDNAPVNAVPAADVGPQPVGETNPQPPPVAGREAPHTSDRPRRFSGRSGRAEGRGRGRGGDKPKDEFDSKIIDLSRVTRVMAGGKRMRFRATVVVGDKKGRVGMAVSKGADVTLAVNKSTQKAKKNLMSVPLVQGTIPHTIEVKFGAARVLLKPAPQGTGVIAGGPVRAVLDLAGVKNVVSKMKGSKNKVANVRAVMQAFTELQTSEERERILKS